MAWRPGDPIPSRPSRPAWAKRLEAKPRRSADQVERDRFIDRKAWRETRAAYWRAHPTCELCLAEGRRGVAASHVHHKISRAARPDLALDWANLQSLCRPCHSRLTIAERATPA